MEIASAAFLEAVRRSMRLIRQAIGASVIDPAQLTCAECIQYDGYLRREEASRAVKALADDHTPVREIVRRTGRSRKLVRDVLRGGSGDVFRCRMNALEAHLAEFELHWREGCRNGAELWRRLRNDGFKGGARRRCGAAPTGSRGQAVVLAGQPERELAEAQQAGPA